MHHIPKPLSWISIIAMLIAPILSTTHQDYTYQDCGLSHSLKIYKNINIDTNKIDSICRDMRSVKECLEERQTRKFFPLHTKHPLLIPGYKGKESLVKRRKED